jgi:hypothetical protein
MQYATATALAFVNAAKKAGDKHWVARTVWDRVDHTSVGVKSAPDLKVRVSNKQRTKILGDTGVLV